MNKTNGASKIKKSGVKKPEKAKKLIRFLIALLTFMVVYVLLAFSITPSQYDIKVGDPAPTIIKATKEIVDEITTRRNQDNEVAKVSPVKKYVGTISEKKDEAVNGTRLFLDAVSEIKVMLDSRDDSSQPVSEDNLKYINEKLAPTQLEITLEQLETVAKAKPNDIQELYGICLNSVEGYMGFEIFPDEVSEIKQYILEELKDVSENDELILIYMLPVEKYVNYNVYYDEADTEALRQAAREKATVVKYVTGQVIVSDGEPITEAQYAMMETLGLINESEIDFWLYFGIGLLLFTLIASIILYLYMFERDIYKSPKKLLIISIACVITLLVCELTKQIEITVGNNNVYIMPVTLAIFIIALLVNMRTALFINLPLCVVASMLSGSTGSFFELSSFTMIISGFVSGCVALRMIKKKQSRLGVLLAGVAAGVTSIVTTFSINIMGTSNIRDSLYMALYYGLGGPGSAVICIAVMPAFEAVFNAITTTRLIELSNPNHPLLRRLLLEAPGTYHHSIIVANLAEAAAAEVGANSLLARVGAYYHDIGKLMRPSYFTENQMGDNPHDRTDPRVSTAIITAHTKDGVQLLKDMRMPEEIKNIALTHHGDTPVVYFYNKALSENADTNVDDFRYPGPKPHTREEAIVMLADSVEAATRSIQNPDKDRVRDMVDKLISQKIDDGQLDDCDISFSDISKIENAFITVLSGAFHERIEYPNVDIPKKHQEELNSRPDTAEEKQN
ncbi:MAG: HDIG domain-containing protein [Clostridia bacterium]|nr:HDIG domain-containing protein [Clostridia bacterium]